MILNHAPPASWATRPPGRIGGQRGIRTLNLVVLSHAPLPIGLSGRRREGDSNAQASLADRPPVFETGVLPVRRSLRESLVVAVRFEPTLGRPSTYCLCRLGYATGGRGEIRTPTVTLLRRVPLPIGLLYRKLWSGQRDLHPPLKPGELACCCYTMAAASGTYSLVKERKKEEGGLQAALSGLVWRSVYRLSVLQKSPEGGGVLRSPKLR
jgi:hypothetical protein